MINELKIIVLVDDKVRKQGLQAEHGLSFWFKYRGEEFLFDTGQGMVLSHNAEKLNIDLKNISAVFLSHGHYDHTGGLSFLAKNNPEVEVYGHKKMFLPKYNLQKNSLKRVGSEIKPSDFNFYNIDKPTEIRKGLWLTGEVEMKNDFEKIPEKYKTKINDKVINDNFVDDQSLVIETTKGLVVLLGCSHRGVINILDHIKGFKNEKIYAVIGGFHLINASRKRIKKTIKGLKDFSPQLIIPTHCTGFDATRMVYNKFYNKFRYKVTGDDFII